MNTIITLTTDFGLTDEYVGVMKGVILAHNPAVHIVDLTHYIRPQNISQAAFAIGASYRYFPKGSIHVVVVDPGVGSKRRIILLRADGHLFIAPDNGVLSLVHSAKTEDIFEITNEDYFLKPVSNTFHGRDIMAPAAAHLAGGLDPAQLGPRLEADQLRTLPITAAQHDKDLKSVLGSVVTTDHFGNLITNIPWELLARLPGKPAEENLLFTIRATKIAGLKTAYNEAADGILLAIIGSRGFVEICANMDSAARILEAGPGDEVRVSINEEL